jgi:hypothetical protein
MPAKLLSDKNLKHFWESSSGAAEKRNLEKELALY